MKLSMKHLVLVSMLSLLAVGCGKKDSKGGSNNDDNFNPSTSNPIIGGTSNDALTGNSTGTDAEAKLTTWLSGVQSGGLINTQVTRVDKECAQFLGTQCITNNRRITVFWPGTVQRSYNTSLANVLNADVAAGFSKIGVSQSNSQVTITFSKSSGNDDEVKVYLIDTRYHAVINPVEYYRFKNDKLEESKVYVR